MKYDTDQTSVLHGFNQRNTVMIPKTFDVALLRQCL